MYGCLGSHVHCSMYCMPPYFYVATMFLCRATESCMAVLCRHGVGGRSCLWGVRHRLVQDIEPSYLTVEEEMIRIQLGKCWLSSLFKTDNKCDQYNKDFTQDLIGCQVCLCLSTVILIIYCIHTVLISSSWPLILAIQ